MNLLKKIITGITLLCICSMASYAQHSKQGNPNHEEMVKQLNLTPQQGESMKLVKQKYKPQLKALKESTAAKQTKQAQRKVIKGKMDTEIKSILNDQQYVDYLALKKARKEERKANHEEKSKRLNLSSDQEASMKAIKQKYHPELKALKEITAQREEKKAKRKAIHNKMEAEIKMILDDQQYSEYLKIKEERKNERRKKTRSIKS